MTKKLPVKLSTNQLQKSLIKSIGQRLREAREINNLSQTEAARRLGYANSSKLAKVERASDTNSIPHWLIAKAANLYDVSIDYLYGTTDDFELDARKCIERDTAQWVFDAMEEMHLRSMDALKKLNNKTYEIDGFITRMLEASDELNLAFERFMQINPCFDDMRGGSRVLRAVERIKEDSRASARKMSMFRKELSNARMAKIINKKLPPQSDIDIGGPIQSEIGIDGE